MPYVASLYFKKANACAAWAAMIGGFVCALPPLSAKLAGSQAAIGSFGRISDMGPHFACAATVVSLLFFLAVGAATKNKASLKKAGV